MPEANLIQYVFTDGSEQIVNQRGKLVAVRDPVFSKEYIPWRGVFAPRVQGSVPNLDSLVDDISDIPRAGEYLISFRGFLIFGRQFNSIGRIREINEGFKLPEKQS